MERLESFSAFVEQERVKDIRLGQSGAVVCEISGNRIAKLVQREKLTEEGLWEKYIREEAFYRFVQGMDLPFVPRILFAGWTDDELLLVMEKYHPIDRRRISDALLDRVTAVLARIHALPVPVFAMQKEQKPPVYTEKDTAAYVKDWESVLGEHGDVFEWDVLQKIAGNINAINRKFHSRRVCFTHGDFYFDNLLQDDGGNIVVCDWQGCGCGDPSGDLSFLMSRLASDGYPLHKEKLVSAYCRHAKERGMDVRPEDVYVQMALSNLNISFVFWHEYLHHAPRERVAEIYGRMVEDYRLLKKKM